jgi:malonate-semialdehyde dehydrogenase (acetylating)/methylmalonate-semialdehyde dehydrogenase
VDLAVAAAAKAFPGWRDTSLIAKTNIFFAFRQLMYDNREELARLITRDHGKTFPDALAEVLRGLETVEFACGLPVHLAGMMTPNVSTRVDAFTLRAPLGVTAAITPFNFPVMVPTWIYPISIMCGNTIVIKPSSHTPGATQLQADLWQAAGLPDGVFNIVYGGKEAVRAIVEHPVIKAIQFVGSTAVGRYVYEEGTRRGKRVGAFTSAKNAMLVLPDADMDMTADAAVAAGFGSAGERCMAQTMLIAVGDTAERLRPKILERIAKLKISNGMEPGADMGPIYSAEHRESIIAWIDRGEAEGAELVVDGRGFHNPDAPDGFFLGVSLFDHVTPDMDVYNEEIFGPVLGMVHAATFDEGLGLINGHKYANGTAIFTTNGGAARRFKLECEVPMIGVNVPIPVPAGYMSFSGAKASAFGDLAMRGEDGVRFFTQQKMVTERWPEPGKGGPLSLVFPGNS